MEALDSTKMEAFEFVAVKDEPPEELETVEPVPLQFNDSPIEESSLSHTGEEDNTMQHSPGNKNGPDVLEVKEEEFEDASEPDISDMNQEPETGHLLEMLEIELKEDEATGPNEKELNSEQLLWSTSGNCTTTPREALINTSGVVNVDSSQPSPYICELCGEVFLNAVSLSKHSLNIGEKPCVPAGVQTFENLSLGWWFCEICQKRFKSKDFLTAHMSGHATEIEKTASHVKEETDTKECIYNCDVCNKPFSQLSRLASHRCHQVKPCPYSCEVCGKSFTDSAKLARHASIHSGVHPYKCNVCGKSFAQLFHMKRHKLTHTGEQPYVCNICNKSYNRSDRLESHKRTHTGELPYCCESCGRGFRDSSNLKRHKRLHTGERPYSCDICGRTFTQSVYMKEHRKTHEKKRDYTCDNCGKTFSESNTLTLSRLNGERKRCKVCLEQVDNVRKRRLAGMIGAQSNFVCEECGKSFARLSGLQTHKLIHTGERPFSCEHCGMCFTQAGGLKRHINTHTDEPPYICHICGKCYELSSSLKKHKAHKHKM